MIKNAITFFIPRADLQDAVRWCADMLGVGKHWSVDTQTGIFSFDEESDAELFQLAWM